MELELVCPCCREQTELHCLVSVCTWMVCETCELIFGIGVIPTWDRYKRELNRS